MIEDVKKGFWCKRAKENKRTKTFLVF